MQVICPTWQVFFLAELFWQVFLASFFLERPRHRGKFMGGYAIAYGSIVIQCLGHPMYYVAAMLAVLAGLFYAAGNNELGSLGVQMCRYGSTFCDHPSYVLVGAILAAIWAAFVSIR
jgi:hypothetical protein